jgi:uncharacterized protein
MISFFISWLIWFLAPIISPTNMAAQRIINMVGAFGPSLGGVIITLLACNKPPKLNTNRKAFFLIFLAILPLTLLSMKLVFQADYQPLNIALFALASLMASFIISLSFSHNEGLQKLLGSLLRGRIQLKWYLFALFIFPAASLLSLLIDYTFTGTIPTFYNGTFFQYLNLTGMTFIAFFLYGGSLNEEVGWRGFAMPQLLKKYSPFAATIILGILWTVWHGPLHFNGFYGDGLAGFVSRFPQNISLTFFFSFLYLRTKGNLFMALLLHTSINFTFAVIPLSQNSFGYITILLVLVLLAILHTGRKIWWKSAPKETFH